MAATAIVLSATSTAPTAGCSTTPPREDAGRPGIAKMLQPAPHQRFWITFRYVALLEAMVRGRSRGPSLNSLPRRDI